MQQKISRVHVDSVSSAMFRWLRQLLLMLLVLAVNPAFSADVLLVDDDDNVPDVRSYYTAALDALGVSYDVWDTNNTDNEPNLNQLNPYGMVVWFTGDATGGTTGPGSAAEGALPYYLNGGGCLFISSEDYYWDRGLTAFMQNYLGVSSVTSDVSQTGVTGEGFFSGLGPYTLSYPVINWSDAVNPDGITSGGETVTAFSGNAGSAAIYKISKAYSYRTSFWGFPFEAIPTAADRAEAMQRVYAFCHPRVLLVDDDDNSPDVRSYYTDVLNTLGVSYDVWDTDNSDDEPGLNTLNDYDSVIWFTGDETGGAAGPGSTAEGALPYYLNGGGRFFISSEDYYYDRGLTAFMQNYLGVASATSDVAQTSVTGVNIFSGLGSYALSYPVANWSDIINPDGVTAGGETVTVFSGNAGSAAVYKNGNSYRTSFWGFPFEAIPTATEREYAMWRVLTYLGPDSDGDGFLDTYDQFPFDPTEQYDTDGDGIGNNADPDDDNDGYLDGQDNCPYFAYADQSDFDGDGYGDPCDIDDDDDGADDTADNCPLVANATQTDTDGDGLGDPCDADDDNDGHYDTADNCPLVVNPSQTDTDGNGVGDACDPGPNPEAFVSEYRFERMWPVIQQPWYFGYPKKVLVDRGAVYVLDEMNIRVMKLSRDGRLITQWGRTGGGSGEFINAPTDLTVDNEGNIYVGDGLTGNSARIQKFTPDGEWVAEWAVTGSSSGTPEVPVGLAFHADRIYAVLISSREDPHLRPRRQSGSPGSVDFADQRLGLRRDDRGRSDRERLRWGNTQAFQAIPASSSLPRTVSRMSNGAISVAAVAPTITSGTSKSIPTALSM